MKQGKLYLMKIIQNFIQSNDPTLYIPLPLSSLIYV